MDTLKGLQMKILKTGIPVLTGRVWSKTCHKWKAADLSKRDKFSKSSAHCLYVSLVSAPPISPSIPSVNFPMKKGL